MIRVNDITVDDEQRSLRLFKRIVQAAKPSFLPVIIDKANHIVRGLLQSNNGDAFRAFLSYEDKKRRVRIAVVLKPAAHLSERQRDVLEQLQCSSEMSRFDRDREQPLLTLRASSVCWRPEQAEFTIRQLVQDICQVLADDRLKVVLANKQEVKALVRQKEMSQ
jgi:hypothetical protein